VTDEEPEVTQEFRAPEMWGPGVYANGISVYYCETDVTFDFFVNLPPEQRVTDGRVSYVIPQQIVARVKMTPAMAMYAGINIATTLAQYEEQYKKIEQLIDQPPLIPPTLDEPSGGQSA
jgi:hypothetical protein